MGQISVAEAARRLGVGVARLHQRIAAGSLPATRVGAQWVIDEEALEAVAESSQPGRPLSGRSAWALVAASGDGFGGDGSVGDGLAGVAPQERARARDRLRRLRAEVAGNSDEPMVREFAALLRSWLRNRAERQLFRASPRDLPALRGDQRVRLAGLSHPRSDLAAADLVEGYVDGDDRPGVVDDHLLSPVSLERQANVFLHVTSGASLADGDPPLLVVAADLAEHRRPREEARAFDLVRQLVSGGGVQ